MSAAAAIEQPEPERPPWWKRYRSFDADGNRVLDIGPVDPVSGEPVTYTYAARSPLIGTGICIDPGLLVPRNGGNK